MLLQRNNEKQVNHNCKQNKSLLRVTREQSCLETKQEKTASYNCKAKAKRVIIAEEEKQETKANDNHTTNHYVAN